MKWLGGFSLLALASAGVVGMGGVLSGTPVSAKTGLIVPEDVYRLCERRQFKRSEIRAIQKRPDYAMILRYTADQCGGVAAVLSEGATATLRGAGSTGAEVSRGSAALGSAAECTPGLGLENSCDPICERTKFTTREISRLQRRKDFPTILEYSLQNCPAVAAVLTDTATATLPGGGDDRGDGGSGGGTGGGGGGTGGGGGGGLAVAELAVAAEPAAVAAVTLAVAAEPAAVAAVTLAVAAVAAVTLAAAAEPAAAAVAWRRR